MGPFLKIADLTSPRGTRHESGTEGTVRVHWNRKSMADLTGKPAVPFRLQDGGGGSHQLEEYRGRWLLMVFHRHLG